MFMKDDTRMKKFNNTKIRDGEIKKKKHFYTIIN